MKQKALLIACYALLIFIGGLIGHLVAHSMASLIASSIIALFLFTCSGFIMQGRMFAYHAATIMTAFLVAFFTYRFTLSYKIAPSGIMAIISAMLLIYLVSQRKKLESRT